MMTKLSVNINKVATMATDEESPLIPKGVYLVKVGTLAAKKVVVF